MFPGVVPASVTPFLACRGIESHLLGRLSQDDQVQDQPGQLNQKKKKKKTEPVR